MGVLLEVADAEVPLEVVEAFLSKFREKRSDEELGRYSRHRSKYHRSFKSDVWRFCNDIGRWSRLWRFGSPRTLQTLTKEIFETWGDSRPSQQFLFCTIIFLWRSYLVQEERAVWPRDAPRPSPYHRTEANAQVQQQLLEVTSIEDLEAYPGLKSLWEKTVVLLKRMCRDPKEFLIHEMIRKKKLAAAESDVERLREENENVLERERILQQELAALKQENNKTPKEDSQGGSEEVVTRKRNSSGPLLDAKKGRVVS